MADEREWRLIFLPLPDDVPAAIRIRRLLKTALRQLRLKCVRLEPSPKENHDGEQKTAVDPRC
jgi:hypothetical protein